MVSLSHARQQASDILGVETRQLISHPDVFMVQAGQELSLGIEKIREIRYVLSLAPIASSRKVIIINDFHFATVEAQNAFLKTFEEPPEYAYIFLVTPYVDRLLKTIVSRAQVMSEANHESRIKNQEFDGKLQDMLAITVGERLLWLENETKALKDKAELKQWLMKVVDELLIEGIEFLKQQKIKSEAIEYLKEAKWKIEQGFPVPKLLLEGFLLQLP